MRRPGWLTCVYGGLLAAVVAFGGALLYLKLHESELVFRTALSHQRATGQLPPDAERLVIREAGGSQLAAVILRPEPAHDSGYWVLHLHGNADSAFSSEQLGHCESLKQLGFSVLSFDYRGFGLSAGSHPKRIWTRTPRRLLPN
jgi:pimeloyl-ACP methyl ester carboxylesterase